MQIKMLLLVLTAAAVAATAATAATNLETEPLPGSVRYANASLTIGKVYPDDYDPTLPEPNHHNTSVRIDVSLNEPSGQESLVENGFEYVDISSLELEPILETMRSTGSIFYHQDHILRGNDSDFRESKRLFDAQTIQALHEKLQYATIPLSASRGRLKLLWVPRYGLMSWAVSPLGLHGHGTPPHSHCDSDLTGEPLYSMTRGLAPWLFHRRSPLQLLNIWFPNQPIPCQPLVVMDMSTLNQEENVFKHNLYRHGKPLIQSLVQTHAPDQRWVVPLRQGWNSSMAVVFATGWTPHTSSPIPGEHLTAPLFELIKRVNESIEAWLIQNQNQNGEVQSMDNASNCICGDIDTSGLVLEDDSEDEVLTNVPVLKQSLDEMRSIVKSLRGRCQEIGCDGEKAAEFAKELDGVLRRGMGMRLAVRVIALRWDPTTLFSMLVLAVLSGAWMRQERKSRRQRK